MAAKKQSLPDVVQRLDQLEDTVGRIDRNVKRLSAIKQIKGFEEKKDRVIYDGVKTMSFKQAALVPGHWEVRGREWVKIADK
jgi:hypothetical protein